MIVRSIIFYSSDVCKNIAINIAKGLKGYVDVESYSINNPHIEMDQFHNVIFVVENQNEDLLNCLKKYAIYLPFKSMYFVLFSDKNIKFSYEDYKLIKTDNIKELVVNSIEQINSNKF